MKIPFPTYSPFTYSISWSENKGAENGFLLNRLIYIINKTPSKDLYKTVLRDN